MKGACAHDRDFPNQNSKSKDQGRCFLHGRTTVVPHLADWNDYKYSSGK